MDFFSGFGNERERVKWERTGERSFPFFLLFSPSRSEFYSPLDSLREFSLSLHVQELDGWLNCRRAQCVEGTDGKPSEQQTVAIYTQQSQPVVQVFYLCMPRLGEHSRKETEPQVKSSERGRERERQHRNHPLTLLR